MEPEAVVTRVFERHACLYVEGRVLTSKGWLKASFTVSKPDVASMNRETFHAFALRQLPAVTEDKQWDHKGEPIPA